MAEKSDLVGSRFGKLVVEAPGEPSAAGGRRWLCRCDCGGTTLALDSNLRRGHSKSCGCSRQKDLTGRRFGKLTVLERSDQTATRGQRTRKLWKCRCDCGAITYKATDTLTNSDISMCKDCAAAYGTAKAREKAGYVGGTQLAKIREKPIESTNQTGFRGVYRNSKTSRFVVRIKFQGKLYHLGCFDHIEDAIKARLEAEEKFFGPYRELQNP